ncbi:Ser-Thr-rich glycosyl-phosphatidyl-inositol-anchored membrane family-domain-containing protein [Daldinia decipiens]|uniref:Ser-Thr-rich glycosyl-phosphatidyl-inositol-anchored membrane family-domain-containing protein n=1 Tax=Daldinia decipiens TaxID=326647 RepID=UPI0020C3D90E|nr:Ser-Thr-rich glycosyl-phosphatidyl-inositol-anchored membrane family-domain-containing protein [Daldinia decipiens]KAI1660173.1 Ser-Thr-rich glycosyl-phosphatidyl-inositol-anchored membrane family-domain-containing protein [Daldinia decipiens]
MRSTTFASALAFAASAFAQTPGYAVLTSPADGQKVPSGQTFTIQWQPGQYTGPATITLLGGETPTTLTPGPVLATVEVSQGTFSWKVDCALGTDKTYGIRISSVANSATFQYSFPFAIAGPSCSSGAGETPKSSASVASVASSSTAAGGYPTEGYPTQGYPTLPSSSSSSSSVISSTSSSAPPSYPTAPPAYPTAPAPSSSSTVVSNTTIVVSTPKVPTYPTAVTSGNLSTTVHVPTYPTTIITSSSYSVVTPVPSASVTTSAPPSIPTAGASNVAAGSLALVGGLAFALLGM